MSHQKSWRKIFNKTKVSKIVFPNSIVQTNFNKNYPIFCPIVSTLLIISPYHFMLSMIVMIMAMMITMMIAMVLAMVSNLVPESFMVMLQDLMILMITMFMMMTVMTKLLPDSFFFLVTLFRVGFFFIRSLPYGR